MSLDIWISILRDNTTEPFMNKVFKDIMSEILRSMHHYSIWDKVIQYWNNLDPLKNSKEKSYVRHVLATLLRSFLFEVTCIFCNCPLSFTILVNLCSHKVRNIFQLFAVKLQIHFISKKGMFWHFVIHMNWFFFGWQRIVSSRKQRINIMDTRFCIS